MNGHLLNKKEKIIEKNVKQNQKISPKIEPWGTPDITVSKLLCLLFI